jgi:hypothetical protein
MKEEDANRILNKAVHELGEHFQAVRIFASTTDGCKDGEALRVTTGTGNWFAQYGQVKHWVIGEEESTREQYRKANDG